MELVENTPRPERPVYDFSDAAPLIAAAQPMIEQLQDLLVEIRDPAFNGATRLDCTLNESVAWLEEFFEVLANYEEGHVPWQRIRPLITLTEELIQAELARYPDLCDEINIMAQAFRRSAVLWKRNYEVNLKPRKIYHARLFESRKEIIKAICDFSRKLYKRDMATTRDKDPPRPAKTKRKTAARKPRRTKFMDEQDAAMRAYLESKGRKPESVTSQDWRLLWNRPENKRKWDEAARRNDRYRGYKSPESAYGSFRLKVLGQ